MRDQQQRSIGRLPEIPDEVEDLCLDGDVECRRWLVGNQQRRLRDQGGTDHDALAHAAGKLVRKRLGLTLGIRQADASQHRDASLPRLRAATQTMVQKDAHELLADPHVRIQCKLRVLEYDANAAGADVVEFGLARTDQFLAVVANAATDMGVGRQQPQHRQCGLRFAGPRLADDTHCLTGRDRKRQFVDDG